MKGLEICTFWLLIVIFFSRLHAIKETGDTDLGCPIRSYKFKDYCYAIEFVKTHFDLAELMCERMDGILAPIEDDETFYFIQKLRIRKYWIDYWFNFNDKLEEGRWVHGDNTTTEFHKWALHEPNNYNNNQHCAKEWTIKDFKWDDVSCARENYYICEYPVSKCRSHSYKFGPYCYELSTEFASFDQALNRCKENGGSLASDKNEDIHQFLKALIYAERRWMDLSNEDVDKIFQNHGSKIPSDWFGLRSFEFNWVFTDGVQLRHLSFTKWSRDPTNKNRCASISKLWSDEWCEFQKSFICRYEISKNGTLPKKPGIDFLALKQDDDDKYSGVRITSTSLAFALMGCIVLGAVLIILLLFAGKLTKRVQVIVRTPFYNNEDRENIINND